MITVHHAIESDFWTAADKFDPKKFRNVAQVNTDDLEEAYKLTNNIDKPWIENKEVFPCFLKPQRSTSMGDVLQIGHEYFAVATFGFTKIEKAK